MAGIPHALYRFFAADESLLYVGITCDVGRRWDRHSRDKPWWTEMARSTVEHFDTREAVLAAEEAAIRAEKPRYNIRHNGDGPLTAGKPKADSGVARNRLLAAEVLPLLPDSLVGSYFHGTADKAWQGCVVAEVAPQVYLVELFSWVMGDSTDQLLVPLAEMTGWVFYDDARWMNNAYNYGGVAERWQREREDADT